MSYIYKYIYCCAQSLSHVQLFAAPWTVVHQALLSMGFCRQEYWSVLLFPSPGDLPNSGVEPRSPALQADSFMTLETENTLSYSDRVLDFISYSDLN